MKNKELKYGLSLNPFPHIVMEDYAEEEDFSELIKELIQFEANVRKTQDAGDTTIYCSSSPKFSSGAFFGKDDFTGFPALMKFYQHFSSTSFHVELAEILSPFAQGRMNITPGEIIKLGNEISENSKTTSLKLSSRYIPKLRDAHVDGATSIITFLFYLRLPNDYSTGGDLYLHSGERSRSRLSKLRSLLGLNTHKFTKAVDYKANTLIAMLNGPDSIHEVSMRRSMNVNRIAFHGGISSDKAAF